MIYDQEQNQQLQQRNYQSSQHQSGQKLERFFGQSMDQIKTASASSASSFPTNKNNNNEEPLSYSMSSSKRPSEKPLQKQQQMETPRQFQPQSQYSASPKLISTESNEGNRKKRDPSKSPARSPAASPYLVETSSYCHLARVTEITQEWQLGADPELEHCYARFLLPAPRRRERVSAEIFANGAEIPSNLMGLARNQSLVSSGRQSRDRLGVNYEDGWRNDLAPTRAVHRTTTLPENSFYTNGNNHQSRFDGHRHPDGGGGGLMDRFVTTLPKFLRKTRSECQRGFSAERHQSFEGSGGKTTTNCFGEVRRTMREIDTNFDNANKARYRWRSAEARKIEGIIQSIARKLRFKAPVSKAQAMASEEIMRTKLAEALLDMGDGEEEESAQEPAAFSYGDALQEPIELLRKKLARIDEGYIRAENAQIRADLDRMNMQRKDHWSESMHQRRKRLVSRSEQLSRLTPLITEVREKLGDIDAVCDRERRERKRLADDGYGLVSEASSSGRQSCASRSACSTPFEKRKHVHDLLTSINNELNLIHLLFAEQQQQKKKQVRVDEATSSQLAAASAPVVEVLNKVSGQLDEILDAIVRRNQQKVEEKQLKEGKNVVGLSVDSLETTTVFSIVAQGKRGRDGGEHDSEDEAGSLSELPTVDIPRSGRELRAMQQQMAEDAQSKRSKPSTSSQQKIISMRDSSPDGGAAFRKLSDIVNSDDQKPEKSEKVAPKKTSKASYKEFLPKDEETASEKFSSENRANKSTQKIKAPTASLQVQRKKSNSISDEVEVSPRFRRKQLTFHLSATLPVNRLRLQMPEVKLKASIIRKQTPRKHSNERSSSFEQKKRQRFQENEQLDEEISRSSGGSMSLSRKSSAEDSFQLVKSSTQKTPPRNLQTHVELSDLLSPPPRLSTLPRHTFFEKEEAKEEEPELWLFPKEAYCVETFRLKKRRKEAILHAQIKPEYTARVRATFAGDSFQVDVDQISECGRESVVMVSEEFYEHKASLRTGRELESISEGSNEEAEEEETTSSENTANILKDANAKLAVSINARSDKGSVHVQLEEVPWGEVGIEVQSIGDNSSGAEVPAAVDESLTASSMFRTIKVLENQDELVRSLSRRSSQRSLLTNNGGGGFPLAMAQVPNWPPPLPPGLPQLAVPPPPDDAQTFVSTDEEIPGYVIHQGSTASITCELNPNVVPGSRIEWFRGRNEHVPVVPGRFERVREPLMEVLVISNVQPEDGLLYSIQVNGARYPVAYLIVDSESMNASAIQESQNGLENVLPSSNIYEAGPFESDKHPRMDVQKRQMVPIQQLYRHSPPPDPCAPRFLSQPQTQFVMEGESAIISCQMTHPLLEVLWYKGGVLLNPHFLTVTPNHQAAVSALAKRLHFEASSTEGWYRLIIRDVALSDQGVYLACYQGQSTSITLVVEEHIEERDVQVSGAETDDEDLNDYSVPIGSTATIACELEEAFAHLPLHWQLNHQDLDDRIATHRDGQGANRLEHVVAGTKHYLIVHNAQPQDSGVYSVRIGDSKFKVAQITVTEEGRLSTTRIKRISSSSLHRSY